MDRVTRLYYELWFELDFLKMKGDEFQDRFATVMEKRYPGDFVRVRPWGNVGDRKNDGYLRSKRTLFQVYAPNELELAKTLAKIDADFNGALPYWKQHFDVWTFVHNARNGLAPDVAHRLLTLEAANAPLKCPHLGYEELRAEFFQLTDADIASILGFAPTQRDLTAVGHKDVQLVLNHIATVATDADTEVREVHAGKLEANALSPYVAELLRTGMYRAKVVERFFERYHDPMFGDRVARAFNSRYVALRDAGQHTPDSIFMELQEFAGGADRNPSRQVAVLAVLAHLFETCDIFEQPPKPRSAQMVS